jgi:tRNA1Val (adenine37-N6)-methyltransferase
MDVTLDSIRDIQLFQSKNGYRFSVDSLLLYDFVNLKRANRIADLGAGSGIIGILLGKKYPDALVTLFELQEGLVQVAEENIVKNKLVNRAKVIRSDIRSIHKMSITTSHSYDLAVSNPPFRRLLSGRLNSEEEKAIARHEIKLTLHELVHAASFLLKTKGRFCIIYHPNRIAELLDILRKKGFEPKRLRFVHSTISSEAKMVLVESIQGGRGGLKVENPFFIYTKNSKYSDEMNKIYRSESEI